MSNKIVHTVTFVDVQDGATIKYDGPFSFTRDGGSAEVTLPIDPGDDAGIYEATAENLTERVGDIVIARNVSGVESSGIIDAADVVEDMLIIRIDDAEYLSPSDIDSEIVEEHYE